MDELLREAIQGSVQSTIIRNLLNLVEMLAEQQAMGDDWWRDQQLAPGMRFAEARKLWPATKTKGVGK